MSNKHYDEAKVLKVLIKKYVKVDTIMKHLTIPKDSLGIRNWGKVNYLVNFCGYTYTIVDQDKLYKERQEAIAAAKAEKKQQLLARRGNGAEINLKLKIPKMRK